METQTDDTIGIGAGVYILGPQNVNIIAPPTDTNEHMLPYYVQEPDDSNDPDYIYGEENKKSKKKKKKRENEDETAIVEYNDKELDYYRTLSKKERQYILMEEQKIQTINFLTVPLRFMILESKMDDKLKAYAINKLDSIGRMDPSSGEYNKMMNFLEAVSKIPVGKYKNLACTKDSSVEDIRKFLNTTRDKLDKTVFGHNDCKDQIIRLLAQWISNPNSNGLVIGIEGPMGCGKCHAKDTPILMYDGTIRMVQDIKVGDLVMGDDSTPRTVLSLGRGRDLMYDIVYPLYNEKHTVNSEHILCLYQVERGHIHKNDNRWDEYMYMYKWYLLDYDFVNMCNKKYKFSEYDEAIAYKDKHCVPRYIEIQVKDYISLPEDVQQTLRCYRNAVEFQGQDIKDAYEVGYEETDISHYMKTASMDSRFEILAGILDKCGLDMNCNICVDDKKYAEGVLYIARSLGLGAIMEENAERKYSIYIFGPGVVNIKERKFNSNLYNKIGEDTYIHFIVEEKEVGKYYGFTLDGNHKYIMGDFTVTHNTTLVKEGICNALGLPFGFVPLGGISDGSYLVGHSYTYEGSKWGRIVEILMNCGCMNPILFFDELDKVSTTRYGDEIKNILIHLTDSSQNTDFHDKYFSELALDLSKCLVIFSYNNEEFINPILKDRMVTIKTSGYTNQNKVEIVEQYMLKELYNKFSFKDEDLVFPRDIISTIIRKTQEEKGVRNLKRSLEEILSQINLARLLNKGILSEDSKPITYPYTITQEDVEKLLKKTPVNDSLPMMYC